MKFQKQFGLSINIIKSFLCNIGNIFGNRSYLTFFKIEYYNLNLKTSEFGNVSKKPFHH